MPETELTARIPCKPETRDEIRALKEGTERHEDVLRRLLAVYQAHTQET